MTVIHDTGDKRARALGTGVEAVSDLAGTGNADLKLWSDFADAGSFSAYCRAWLALQCRAIPASRAGLLLLEEKETFVPAAVWPDQRRDVGYLKSAAEKALMERKGVVLRGLEGGADAPPGKDVHVGYPVVVRGTLYGAVVVHAEPTGDDELQGVLQQLHWGVGWLDALFWRLRAEEDKARLDRAAVALDVLTVTQEQTKLRAAAISCANELVRRLGCERVAIGWRRGNAIRLRAVSHMSQVEKKAQSTDALENAMDEALDQNASVCVPPIPGEQRRVGIALEAFAKANGFASAASVVMPARGNSFGVITFMRKGEPFDASTLHLAEAVAGLVGPVLEQKQREHRWFAGRVVDGISSFLGALFGRRHPTLKLASFATIAAGTWLATATGSFNITARSVVEGAVQRAAVAPFDGYLTEAAIRAGDTVRAGDVLAVLDDKDLKLERLKWQTEKEKALQKMREASAEHDRAAIAVYSAQARQADSQLTLAEEVLSRTRVVAPIDGFVVSGDLSQMLGAPVERGKVLFEIAPLSSYRIVLQVDERDIQYVQPGQKGTFAPTGLPDAKFSLTVSNITAIAAAEEGRNTFRVEASVGEAGKLRPGMEGVARLDAGQGKLAWIWTRGLVDWAKLTWWSWKPL